jgi:putative transposase
LPLDIRRRWVNRDDPFLSMREQLRLSGVSKTAYYYEPAQESADNLTYMEIIDREYTEHPFYGSRQLTAVLRRGGYPVNRKRIVRLMRVMGLEAIYPKPHLSKPAAENRKYPYLLKGLEISSPNQVWGTDITYIPVRGGFLYLTAVMDWFARYVISWRLSNTLDVGFCLEALEEALSQGTPKIFNSDQGSQFTSREFTNALEARGVQISMDGKGRAFDNIFVERLWRTIKYEEVYLKKYETGLQANRGLNSYMRFYNDERPHQALGYCTPREAYYGN